MFHGGKLVGHRRRYSDGLLRALLPLAGGRPMGKAEAGRAQKLRPGWRMVAVPPQAEIDAKLMQRLEQLRQGMIRRGEIADPGHEGSSPPA